MHFIVKSHRDAKKLCKKKKKGPWMILYKANWCGHCKMLKPEWKKFTVRMKKVPRLNIAEVDSDYMSSMDEQIMGYPTIKMYHNNRPVADFQDNRTANNLKYFAMNNMPRPSHSQEVHNKPKTVVKKTKTVVRKPKTVVKKTKTVVRKPKTVSKKTKTVVRKPKTVSKKTKTVSKKSSQNLINRMKKRRMSTQLSNRNIIASLRKSLSNID
jgi:hypothetical protein